MRRAVLTLALFALFAFSACNCGTQKVHVTSGVIAVEPQGSTTAAVESDTALRFDPQCLANMAIPAEVKTVALLNEGESALSVKSVTITGISASAFTIDASTPAPTSIAPAATVTLKIDFDPSTAGNQSANLVIVTNDEVKPTVTVQLVGSGSALPAQPTFVTACPLIDGGVDPSETGDCYQFLFPQTFVGMSSTQPIHITNNGCPPLQITGVAIYPGEFGEGPAGPDGGSAWTVHGTAPTIAAPLTIASGATSDLSIDFSPFTSDFYAANVLVTTNGSGDNTGSQATLDGGVVAASQFAIALSGTGQEAGAIVQPSDCNFTSAAPACSPTASGSTLVGAFQLINSGNADLMVTSITLSNPADAGFSLGTGTTTPFTVAANSDETFTVIYSPVPQQVDNSVVIVTSAGTLTATLEAGSPPSLVTSPTGTLDFGDQATGTYMATANLEVGNAGSGALSVAALTLTNPTGGLDGGSAPCVDFTVDPASVSALPYAIPADAGPQTAVFHHHPEPHGGQSRCSLAIQSNDPSFTPPAGLQVVLEATTYTNCDPVAVESPATMTTFSFPDAGNTLIISGAGSYDPGVGDPLGNVAACPGGQSQGVKQWEWQLFTDPGLGATTTTSLEPRSGAVSVCLQMQGAACVDLLVSNQQSLLTAPDATDASVTLALDPTYRNHVNLYQVQLNVIDGSADGGFTSPPTTLNISVQ